MTHKRRSEKLFKEKGGFVETRINFIENVENIKLKSKSNRILSQ